MNFMSVDFIIIIAYLFMIYLIAYQAHLFMKKSFVKSSKNGMTAIENHYLAGHTITFWEAFLSILATEFSALAFLSIPTYVYFGNLNYINFVIGAGFSRMVISIFFLPLLYGKGLTIFEVIAKGVIPYKKISNEGIQGKRTFALLYIITKSIGVSVRLLGGATILAHFFDIPIVLAIIIIAFLTYIYVILGGLKAVVRTDMVQATVFIIGGFVAHYMIGQMSSYTWGELFTHAVMNNKLSFLDNKGLLVFIYGIIAGFIYDVSTHGVDQDITQKIFGVVDEATAKKVIQWSAFGSLFVNLLFLSLGCILWSYYNLQGIAIPPVGELFSSLIENHFPSPMKGLMAAAILAACMSTLDSSINAMSACLWNDILGSKKLKMFRLYISIDNLIIIVSIVMLAYVFSMTPSLVPYGLHFSYLSTAPLLAFFAGRMLLVKYIKINNSIPVVLVSFFACFFGMALNHFRFGFDSHLTIVWGVVTSFVFLWVYSYTFGQLKPAK